MTIFTYIQQGKKMAYTYLKLYFLKLESQYAGGQEYNVHTEHSKCVFKSFVNIFVYFQWVFMQLVDVLTRMNEYGNY